MQSHLNFLRRKYLYRATNWLNSIGSIARTPKNANVLITTVSKSDSRFELADTQLYPFHFYRKTLKNEYGIQCVQIPVSNLIATDNINAAHSAKHPQIKRIFFQPEYDMAPENMILALERLSAAYPNAKIAYMDWNAPLHIRASTHVDKYIDIYIKKQIPKNFSDYSAITQGDTNLSDYYSRMHNLDEKPTQFIPPVDFEKKLRLGSNFGLSPLMVDLFLGKEPRFDNRDIDLHARITVNGIPWYQAMRQEAQDAVNKLEGIKIVSVGKVRRHQYFAEMMRSKTCFSPFGYGEVCWRDYEAYSTGALLFKPDMSHLKVLPNVYIPYETYVPLEWDLTDFEEKVKEYLSNHTLRAKITRQAFQLTRDWILSKEYSAYIADMC